MITRKYNLVNNIVGWVVFVIALCTYWLTLEPTASFWDCGEFIIQADKLEVGHPPGNPIFMLTARFFANFASGPDKVALMVNAMSGLLSALTILLLFWTITHLVRRLVVKSGHSGEISISRYLAIMGSGVVGALAYAWSDTFWFSAVEGEVYAFSSFCTALVFWLILKWENRASEPHSDRYLILIAYIIGVSVAVHLLNLLCIPAIALVFAYRKYRDMNLAKSIGVLAISFGLIFLVLYGLVPGLIKVAQKFELMFVNGFGCSFNTGVLVYAILMSGLFIWSLAELYRQKSASGIRLSFTLAVAFSGILCFTDSIWVWLLFIAVLAGVIYYVFRRGLPVRVLTVIMWSIAVIFVGYSSYALILIRSTADTPMNQNSPDNVFDLASYLNREQYGDNPLFYGETYNSDVQKIYRGSSPYSIGSYNGQDYTLYYPSYRNNLTFGRAEYGKGVSGAAAPTGSGITDSEIASATAHAAKGGDYYVVKSHKAKATMNPELNMLLPRIYSGRMAAHRQGYEYWVPSLTDSSIIAENMYDIYAIDETTGDKIPELDTEKEYVPSGPTSFTFPQKRQFRPTYWQNFQYFLNYQLNHMYMRYFMWNFAGRQNDMNNQWGEKNMGNWISGIPAIDNARLGDQELLPSEFGEDNAGHNVYYMLPLILGLIGLLWQAFRGKKGIEQFWVVFFLFFMTGIAIVLYLNQPPNQPRERDYAFAGSFYAFAIWIGMGVAALWNLMVWAIARKKGEKGATAASKTATAASADQDLDYTEVENGRNGLVLAILACVLGLAVPLQMVSQTWDDHDRSGRYTARDYAINYLESTEPNAIIFCNGDNDTFPLWYAQEVEGVRPDVRIINLSYLASDWYANQQLLPSYTAAAVPLTVKPEQYAYDKLAVISVNTQETAPMPLMEALKAVYSGFGMPDKSNYPMFPTSKVYVPIDKKVMVERGYVAASDTAKLVDRIEIDLAGNRSFRSKGYISLSELLMLDIIATNAEMGWPRPIYWAVTVGEDYYLGLDNNMATTGMALQLVPWTTQDYTPRTDRIYDVITKKFKWGGGDYKGKRAPYFDETAGRMLTGVRSSMVGAAQQYIAEGDIAGENGDKTKAMDYYHKALDIVNLVEQNQGQSLLPYSVQVGPMVAEIYCQLGEKLGDAKLKQRGLELFESMLVRFAQYILYEQNINITFGGQVQLDYSTTRVPYFYWQYVESYEQYGGDFKALAKKNAAVGKLDVEALKNNYSQVNAQGIGLDMIDRVNQILTLIAGMDKLSPTEYAARPEEQRYYDSVAYEFIMYPEEYGVTRDQIMKLPVIESLDLERQKALYQKFRASHPEL